MFESKVPFHSVKGRSKQLFMLTNQSILYLQRIILNKWSYKQTGASHTKRVLIVVFFFFFYQESSP